MAKIKFGALMVDMRGKQGGTVYSRNKGGAYSKNKVTPLNPRSTAQQLQRSLMASSAGAWRSLTQDQRNAWNENAANFPRTDVFGDTVILSGNALHNQLNLNLTKVGLSPISVCPTPADVFNTPIDLVTATVIALDIDIPSALPSGTHAVIRATPNLSAGISNFNSRLRDIAVANNASGATIDVFSDYVAKFGTPVVGSKIGVQIVTVDDVTGQSGIPVNGFAIVA